MTSPVDTTVQFITSQMVGSGALKLNTVNTVGAGTIIALLDALLVDGWDAVVAASVVVAGGVATITFSAAHSAMQDSVVELAGITGGPTGFAALNGRQKITVSASSTSASFACPTVGNGSATGTLNVKMASCGWSRPFTASGMSMYKSTDIRSNGFILRLDETVANSYSRVRGWETATDINTGGGNFPTDAQVAAGFFWPRAYTASSATAIDFMIFADGMTVYYWARGGQTFSAQNTQGGNTMGFGDLIPARPGDAFATFMSGSVITAVGHSTGYTEGVFTGSGASPIWVPRSYTGLGSSLAAVSYPYIGTVGTTSGADTSIYGPYPDSNTGKLRMSKRAIVQSGYPLRGDLPGIRSFPHSLVWDSLRFFNVIQGDGDDLGRRFMITNENIAASSWQSGNNSAQIGAGAIDITGPWR